MRVPSPMIGQYTIDLKVNPIRDTGIAGVHGEPSYLLPRLVCPITVWVFLVSGETPQFALFTTGSLLAEGEVWLGIGTKWLGVKLVNTLRQVSKLTSTNGPTKMQDYPNQSANRLQEWHRRLCA